MKNTLTMKRFVTLIFTCLLSTFLFADSGIGLKANSLKQKRGAKFDKSRLFVGGGLGGGSLLSGGFFVAGSPTVGYQFTDRLHAGISFGVSYFRSSEPYSNFISNVSEKYVESGFHYSPSLFARYFVFDMLYLQIMPEYNSFKIFDYPTPNYTTGKYDANTSRLNIPSFLAGIGYAQRMGNTSYMTISVMYDLVQNPNSPYYRRPVFGGGLALGLFGN